MRILFHGYYRSQFRKELKRVEVEVYEILAERDEARRLEMMRLAAAKERP